MVDHPPQSPLVVQVALLVVPLLALLLLQGRAVPSGVPLPDSGARTTDSTPAPDMQRRSTARHSVRTRPWTKNCRSS